MGLFDAFRNALGNAILPTPPAVEIFYPAFYQTYVYPPFKADGVTPNDGTFYTVQKLREYATLDTATWLAKQDWRYANGIQMLKPQIVPMEEPVSGGGFIVTGPQGNAVKWGLQFSQAPPIPAGHIAWYYTIRPDHSEDSSELGYWDRDVPPEIVMKSAKVLAERYIENTLMWQY